MMQDDPFKCCAHWTRKWGESQGQSAWEKAWIWWRQKYNIEIQAVLLCVLLRVVPPFISYSSSEKGIARWDRLIVREVCTILFVTNHFRGVASWKWFVLRVLESQRPRSALRTEKQSCSVPANRERLFFRTDGRQVQTHYTFSHFDRVQMRGGLTRKRSSQTSPDHTGRLTFETFRKSNPFGGSLLGNWQPEFG